MTCWFFLAALDPPNPIPLLAVKHKDKSGAAHLQVLHPDLDFREPTRRLTGTSAPMFHNLHFKPASNALRQAARPKGRLNRDRGKEEVTRHRHMDFSQGSRPSCLRQQHQTWRGIHSWHSISVCMNLNNTSMERIWIPCICKSFRIYHRELGFSVCLREVGRQPF